MLHCSVLTAGSVGGWFQVQYALMRAKRSAQLPVTTINDEIHKSSTKSFLNKFELLLFMDTQETMLTRTLPEPDQM